MLSQTKYINRTTPFKHFGFRDGTISLSMLFILSSLINTISSELEWIMT